jgi:hypothetical protein
MRIEISRRFAGPPSIGHGGYVSGLFAERSTGGVQVTLRRPAPLDVELDLDDLGGRRFELRHGDELIATSEPATLSIDVPSPPALADARGAEVGSPSFYDERGVHPTCFGCGRLREPGDGLRIAAGPVTAAGRAQVAAVWRPGSPFAEPDGSVAVRWVLSALDCPGAFAFIVDGVRAGLLGRITFESYGEVRADADHVVTGWQVGRDGRKLLAGTALFDAEARLLAAAQAVWFPVPSRG